MRPAFIRQQGGSDDHPRPCRKQLAYKIMMNSVYGFCGATRGMLPCVEIAAAVTSTGRNMIDHSKRMVESHYSGSQVIYGVSHPNSRISCQTLPVFCKPLFWATKNKHESIYKS